VAETVSAGDARLGRAGYRISSAPRIPFRLLAKRSFSSSVR
jgi:hypothetical protein